MKIERLELEEKLKMILKKKSYTIEESPCDGKWKGTIDYSIIFNDGLKVFISNGIQYYIESLKLIIEGLEYYLLKKDQLEEWIKNVLRNDNHFAAWQRLPKIEFIESKINLDNNFSVILFIVFDYYLCINENQKIKMTYTETGFSHYCKGDPIWEFRKNTKSFIYNY